jgi:hypothetical protein
VLSRVEKRASAGGEFGEVRKLSVKSGSPFISLACSAISSNLLSSLPKGSGIQATADQKRSDKTEWGAGHWSRGQPDLEEHPAV